MSKVIVGDNTVATGLLRYKPAMLSMDEMYYKSCDQLSWAKILDEETAPVVVDKSGEVVVRIETSPARYNNYVSCLKGNSSMAIPSTRKCQFTSRTPTESDSQSPSRSCRVPTPLETVPLADLQQLLGLTIRE